MGRSRVLMIAMDAADLRLVRRWMADGSLPNLSRLCSRGLLTPLKNPESWLSGATWPTFYTGTPPETHGLYHYLQWDPERMAFTRPSSEWLPARPFWRRIASETCKVLVVDPPLTYTAEPLHGVEIIGYAAHDHLHGPSSFPAGYIDEARRRFGVAELAETTETPSASTSEWLKDYLVGATTKLSSLAVHLLEREEWHFALVCFTATHRAGHRLWYTPGTDDAPSAALKAVYVACDQGLGEVLRAAGDDVACLVFSLHGMQENTSRVDILGEMLDRVLGYEARGSRSARGALLDVVRQFVPERVKSRLKSRLPLAVQDRLSSDLWTAGIQWSSKQAFSLISDLLGYVRINVKGREAAGIVEPGAEYERLCDTISAGLLSFRDCDSGKAVVQNVMPLHRRFAGAPRVSVLPDLVVRWSSEPARRHRAIISPSFGSVVWPTLNGHPTGRGGNHADQGFLIASGRGFDASRGVADVGVLDLMPTVYSLLGLELPGDARGTAIRGAG